MSVAGERECLQRFLYPRYAVADCASGSWHGAGTADTPGEDARCRLFLAVGENGGQLTAARFAAFGPPVVIACADWVCERIEARTIASARSLTTGDFEQALKLAPGERYAALLVLDALANALANLGS